MTMQKIRIRTIGRLSESWAKQAQQDYLKRLSPYSSVEVVELPEGHKGSLKLDIERTKIIESVSLLKGIAKDDFVIALDETGTQYSSPHFAEKIFTTSHKEITFLIGGSWGLNTRILQEAHIVISFGKQTLPHALARIVLLEQIYRATLIQSGKTYHK